MWFRRDLRLSDHPALSAAAQTGRPILPVFILDDLAQALGAAPKWRLGLGLETFAQSLSHIGSRLILRRGDALTVLQNLIAETGDCLWLPAGTELTYVSESALLFYAIQPADWASEAS